MRPKAVLVPLEQLDAVTTFVQEDEDTAREDVLTEVVPDDRREPVVGFAEVHRIAAKKGLSGTFSGSVRGLRRPA